MKNVLIVGFLVVINAITTRVEAQPTEGATDAVTEEVRTADTVVDVGASDAGTSSQLVEAGSIEAGATSSAATAGLGESTDLDAGDAGDAGTAGGATGETTSVDETSSPKPPPKTRDYTLIENEGRGCTVAAVGRTSRMGLGASWLVGLIVAVRLRRRARPVTT
jgi:hypothetical protein